MDGRIQEPIITYLKDRFGVEYVDTITEPGPCRILSGNHLKGLVGSIHRRVKISISKHGSKLISISGHSGCVGNQVEDDIQQSQIRESMVMLKKRYPDVQVIGLWLDQEGTIEKIQV